MIGSESFPLVENYVTQYDKPFTVSMVSGYCRIHERTASRIVKYMVEIGMLVQLPKMERTRYYRYNKKFDTAGFKRNQRRQEGLKLMREYNDEFHQVLSMIGGNYA